MFHLFNKLYLENSKWYSGHGNFRMMYLETDEHPVSRLTGFSVGRVPSYQEVIDNEFNKDENLFWENLINREENFFLYADQPLYERLQIKYWKSIFNSPDVNSLYEFYKLFFVDNKLKALLVPDRKVHFPKDEERTTPLSLEEFTILFQESKEIECLKKIDKSRVGFGYLLANYFVDKNSVYSAAFLKQVEDLSWDIFFDNMSILKSEIFTSLYDIKKIIPEASVDFTDADSVIQFLKTENMLKWIVDPRFNKADKDYVVNSYGKELFTQLLKKMKQKMDDNKDSGEEEYIEIVPYIFDGKFDELLRRNIKKGFGCLFLSCEQIRDNFLLPLYVYEKIRNEKLSELQFMKLS